jgi:hypothetical protein
MSNFYTIVLNSNDKVSGTNACAQFKINLLKPLQSGGKVNIQLDSFLYKTPTRTNEGIIQVAINEITNDFSFTSTTKNQHGVIGVFQIKPGLTTNLEYPSAQSTGGGSSWTVTGQNYGNWTYNVSSSPNPLGGAIQAFRTANSWGSARNYAVVPNFVYLGSVSTSAFDISNNPITVDGEWLQIEFPYALLLTDYRITFDNNTYRPRSFYMFGSNDGTTWRYVDFEPYPQGGTVNVETTYPVNVSTAYRFFRIVVTNAADSVQISRLRFFGSCNHQTGETPETANVVFSTNTFTTDTTLFDRNVSVCLTSPNGCDLTNIDDWTMVLKVENLL